MTSVQGPVRPRKLLGAELRRLREEAGLTLEDLAEALMISKSKLSRLETAQGSPALRDVRDLIRHFGLEGSVKAEQFMRWTRAASKKEWWHSYLPTIKGGLDLHVAMEAEAAVIRVYTIPVLPVLLQVTAYTRALYERMEPWHSPAELEKLLEVRHKRRLALDYRDGMPRLKLVAVTHESSIRQLVGSPAIMREQLSHLIERSTLPNVELRVLPFAQTPPFTSTCMWAYFEFDDSEGDVVHVETHAGFGSIETAGQVANYREHHDELMRSSLGPDETRRLIESVRDTAFAD
ncbi:Helix-turn-helix domain-containing protein [Lentzea fradiae]|uniref:Helix-turn-helix domain-containing protein n=1 Tax=Lentzea fradiae TaxID=200378 RepID=A0A1G7R6X0_9PSEU|nr:helix-turn-helix transcriptional regulator [Lentzea fradiae]SDG05899.1 Helix-turn-helix domain-containing protein [Lentzea fradiae]